MKLTKSSLQNPITTMMVFLCVVVVGVIAISVLPLEFFPHLENPFINIHIPYPNSTPEEIERQITRPVEETLATIGNIKRMVSDSTGNDCSILLEFDWGSNIKAKAIEAKEKIDSLRGQLPHDIEQVYVSQDSTSDTPVMNIRISSTRDLSNCYDLLNRHLKRPLERLEGVSRVTLFGAEKKGIHIELSAHRIIAHHIDLNRLYQTLANSHFMVNAGMIKDASRRFTVRPLGTLKTTHDIGNLVVGENNLKLKDIAKITYQTPELNNGRHLNGKFAIGLDIYKEAKANTVEVGKRVKTEIETIKKNTRMKGINLYFLGDDSDVIVTSLNELLKSGLIGAVLAVIILFVFLRQWSTTFIVALAIPFSILVTLAFMYFLDISLNILSMLGLLLAVGMLVDNAVVVTENIYRHKKINSLKGNAAVQGVKEIVLAITAGTFTTVIVFLPNIISSNSEIAIQIKHVAIPFSIALGVSLLMAQTIIPLFVSKTKIPPCPKKAMILDRVKDHYQAILDWLMHHRKVSMVIILVALVSIAIPFRFVKKDMFPQHRDRKLQLFYNLNDNFSLEKVEAAVDRIEAFLLAHREKFEIESVYSYYRGDYASSTILLKKGKGAVKSQGRIRSEIRGGLPALSIGSLTFERKGSGSNRGGLRIYLQGPSSQQLTALSHEVAWLLEKIPGFKDVRSEASTGKREVHVIVNRERANKLGFAPEEVGRTIAAAMRGVNLYRVQDEEKEIVVRAEFQKEDKKNLQHLRAIPLFKAGKPPISLESLADFKIRNGPHSLHRENRKTSIGISINLEGLTVSQAKKKIVRLLKDFNFPAGYSWDYGRGFNFEDETIKTMMINTLLALALIYFVMASLFESLVFPGAIWTSIIFAIIGVWWFFFITGTVFSLMAWMGVLILIGVVVNNGIVLIDYINQLRAKGLSRLQAVVQAGGDRFRPILMTAATTIFSLVPLCFSNTQIGGEGPPYFPMARAIVGGLVFSTFVTLIILPTIYILLDDLRNWARRIMAFVAAYKVD